MWEGNGYTAIHGAVHVGSMVFVPGDTTGTAKLVDFRGWGYGPAALDVADALLGCCDCTTYGAATGPDPKVTLLLKTYATSLQLNGADYGYFEVVEDVAWLLANTVLAWMAEVGSLDGTAGRYAISTADDPTAFSDDALRDDPTFKDADTDTSTFRRVFPAHGLPEAFVIKAAYMLLHLVNTPALAGSTELGKVLDMSFHSTLYAPVVEPPPVPKDGDDDDDDED